MHRHRSPKLAALLLIALLLLAACGGGATPTGSATSAPAAGEQPTAATGAEQPTAGTTGAEQPTAATAASGQQVTVTWGFWGSPEEKASHEKVAAEFMKTHPDIKIEIWHQ
ncbi:hypothetical protein SE17_19155, partial [Kouleothrix aurantiaca]